jgi:methenyltetrahydrofolate cyclohydrolase
MLVQLSVADFMQNLGSDSPAPGGGSVAALSGALAAALLSMVCKLTIGKKGYESFRDEIGQGLDRAEGLSKVLLERVDLDTEAFNGVMAAFKMPKEPEEAGKARTAAVQRGYKVAVQSPLATARECVDVLRVAENLLGKFNVNALSDLGVASQQAFAGLEGAMMNVKINLPSIKDEDFRTAANSEISSLLDEGRRIERKVHNYVSEKLK